MRKGPFDAVITDWDMLRLNGSEFLALSRIFWPETPIIIISATRLLLPKDLLKEPSHGSIIRMALRNCCRSSERLSKQLFGGTGDNPSPQYYNHDHVWSHSGFKSVVLVFL